MAGKADFNEDEWDDLHRGVTGAGMLVALSERGFKSTFQETHALAKSMANAHTNSPSQLVRDLATTKGTGWKVSSSPDEVREGTVAALQRSIALIQERDATDLEPYRAFVITVAENVSAAGKGGDEAEAAAIATVKEALG
jgi:hypothetical protein